MDGSFGFEEGESETQDETPAIVRWVVTVEVGGIAVEKEFTDEQEAEDYFENESENRDAKCSIREETEAITTE
jgi:hypothetical protein